MTQGMTIPVPTTFWLTSSRQLHHRSRIIMMKVERSILLLLVLLLSLLVNHHDGIIAAMDVEVDASGETAPTIANKSTTTTNTEKTTKSYSPDAIQLANTFPTDVFLDNPDGNDLALKVAAKVLFCRRARNLLEVFRTQYTSAMSIYLTDLENNADAGPHDYLKALGELVTGMEDADRMYEDQTPSQILAQMEQEGFFTDVSEIMVEYQLNPRKVIDDTKEGLLYEFIAIAQKAGYITIENE
jgi:hypothetical protein